MLKRVAFFVFAALVLHSSSQPYISLSTQGINFGLTKNRFDYGVGLNFRAQTNNSHTETILKNISGNDTVYSTDSKTTQVMLGPEIAVGYYFSDTKLKPFIQVFSEILFPIYYSYDIDQSKGGNLKEINIMGGLIGGIEYLVADKLSIGSGIGPYLSYNKSEISTNNADKSQVTSVYLSFTSNLHFRYYF
jgi:hypothetical protein